MLHGNRCPEARLSAGYKGSARTIGRALRDIATEGEFDAAMKAFTRGKGPYVINVHLGKLDVAGFNNKVSEAMRHREGSGIDVGVTV